MAEPIPICRNCQTASWILRRIGFKDNIGWSTYEDSPNPIIHAFSANSAPVIHQPPAFEKQADGRNIQVSPARNQVGNHPVPLCVNHRSELAWLTAGRPVRLTVYMAHPVSGDIKRNIANATQWLRYLRAQSAAALSGITNVYYGRRPLILAPWLAAFDRDDLYPGGREGAMQDCRDTVLLFDEVWHVGGRSSEGMVEESSVARVTRDLTHLGELPPIPLSPQTRKTTRK